MPLSVGVRAGGLSKRIKFRETQSKKNDFDAAENGYAKTEIYGSLS